MTRSAVIGTALVLALASGTAAAQEATYNIRTLTPESALKAAQAALKSCRDSGYQVAVAVVDRSGLTQVMLRDRYAGPHTPKTAIGKAWTAVSFRTNTTAMAEMTQPGKPASGIRQLPNVVMVGGGLLIEGGGSIIGGIGVSGAPGGDLDEVCAKAGIAAIKDALEF
ncbi:MAG: heme-binding protein [Rhodocyclaceae bacterium]|nr:heme-binding protein [Rhodocyclaceae bacterium]MCB1891761.1 heme-binding protein [Rhodocyclaceae bacterium]